jgi:hypothetical protein
MTDEGTTNLSPEERRIRAEVRSLREVRAEPAFREKLKRQFVTGEITERPARGSEPSSRWWQPWGWTLIPAAAVAVALLILLFPARPLVWTVHDVSGEGRIVIDGESVTADERDRLARLVGSGARVELAEGIVLDLMLEDRLLFELDEGAQVALPEPSRRPSERPLTSEVHAGELRVKTGPGFSGHRLRILTSESRTDLIGTTVSVFKGDGLTCVCVLEGTARIGEDDARMEEVAAGMRKIMFADGRPSRIVEIEPHHEEGLLRFVERHENVFRSSGLVPLRDEKAP